MVTAGRNEVNFIPFLPRAARARKVNPKNVNYVCSCELHRSPSLRPDPDPASPGCTPGCASHSGTKPPQRVGLCDVAL